MPELSRESGLLYSNLQQSNALGNTFVEHSPLAKMSISDCDDFASADYDSDYSRQRYTYSGPGMSDVGYL